MGTARHRFGGLICLAVGTVGAIAVGRAISSPLASAKLAGLSKTFLCVLPKDRPDVVLGLFAAQSHWVATMVLEGVVAVLAVACAAATLFAIGRQTRARRNIVFLVLLALGFLVIGYDAYLVWAMRNSGQAAGFLSQLLSSIPAECGNVRDSVVWARMLGEPAGIAVGVAMASTVNFAEQPGALELARRSRHLKRLLYVASLLFVAGLMMSRANFVWVLAQWDVADKNVAGALVEVINAGVVQSGVAYSGILAFFFVPARVLLNFHVESAIPEDRKVSADARQKWLEENDLTARWQEEAKQILAVLAPVLSAPVFDVVAKL